ncbi:S-layer homology domain-containing protein [Lysinibacillus sp. NPDC094403]|uniref:S-layer homology domain-containing protein n=1 Tax=Lysinibacillus sp. NPDC094403 TaxID=3390581 RepID=UPI003D07A263
MANQPKKYKKFVATAATATLVASAIVPVASAAGFTDVKGNSHEEAINALADAGIINGYADGTFKPNQTINRGQVVKLLGRWLESEGFEAPADWDTKQRFNDLPLTAEKELVKYAALAKDAGVFAGSNGNLNYTQTMQRQQMAVVLVRAINEIYELDLVKEYKADKFKSEISDLDKAFSAEQREAITALEYAELTNAATLPGKAFNPANSITRGQFASFLYRTINIDATTDVNASVKAINNTTVEVTFDEEQDNVDGLKFEIKDLEIKNAAIKQTNKKVVVLTTAPQKADKEYTVSLNAEEIGKFKGIEAVVPKSIVLKTTNTQGKVGNQVTLTADVGVKTAGIPVTFNIDAPTGSLNKDSVVEVVTNAEGIASYSYTQYAPDADDVTVYPTGAPQLRAFGTVYWGVENILTLEEVTAGNVQANGVKKIYKVTFKDPKTGAALSNRALNVSFVENTNVAFNAISKATVTNPATGLTVTPYQTTTGLVEEIKVTTDSNGQATFVVSGTNTAVTPYVFVDGSSSVLGVSTVTGTNGVTQPATANKKWEATELTATAAQVKFEGAQLNHQITVTRDGEEEAAAQYGNKFNGREYKLKVLDKDGKPYANGLVNIGLDEVLDRNLNTNSKAMFKNVDDSTALTLKTGANGQQGQVKLDSKGEATVLLYGAKGEVGTPLVWIDQNTSQNNQTGVLEDGEPFFKAPISNFQYERVIGAEFTVEGKTSNQNVSKDGIANYAFALTNQSGEALDRLQGKMTYEIRNTSGQPIEVTTPIAYRDQNNQSNTKFKIEEYGSITITADVASVANAAFTVETAPNGKAATVVVTPSFVTANNFDASGDNGATTDARDFNKYVTAAGLTATFGNSTEVGTNYTGTVQYFNTAKKTITFNGKNAVKYAGESGKTYKYFGLGSTPITTADDFIAQLQNHTAGSVTVTYKVVDNEIQFYIVSFNTTGTPAVAEPTAVAPTDGTIAFTNASFNASANQTITVKDADLNANATVADTTTVKVTSGTVVYTLTATETGVNTGEFAATLTTAQLAVLSDGVITATYEDVRNTTGSSVTRTATATLNTVVGAFNTATATPSAPASKVAATHTTTTVSAGTAMVTDTVDFTIGGVTKSVTIPDGVALATAEDNAAIVAAAINAQFPSVATVVGQTVKITAKTDSDTIVIGAAAGTTAGFATTATTVNPTNVAATPAKWEVALTSNVVAGEKVKVVFNGVTKELTAVTGTPTANQFVVGATSAATVANIVAALTGTPAAFGPDYTVTQATPTSNVITITQVTAGTTSATLSATVTK